MSNDKEPEEEDFFVQWAQEESSRWEIHQRINQHIQQRKAELARKSEEHHG